MLGLFVGGTVAGAAVSTPTAQARTPPSVSSDAVGSGGTLRETGTVSYEPEAGRFVYEFDYEIPSQITRLTIEFFELRFPDVSTVETSNVSRDGEMAFVWTGGDTPHLTIAQNVDGPTLSAGTSGGYATDDSALASRLRSRLPFRYRGSSPSRSRSLILRGEGFVGSGYVYSGPHESYTRTVDGSQLAIVVPAEVSSPIRHGTMLDVYELGERTITPRLPHDRITTFVVPSRRGGNYTPGFAARTSIVLNEDVAALDTVRSVAPHEYIHTLFGVFGNDEMYWLREATAEYYGYVLSLNAGLGTFEEFLDAVRTDRFATAVLTDRESMGRTNADYHKGAHVLAALDATIRERTAGTATLLDVLTTTDHDLSSYEGFSDAVVQAAGDPSIADWLDEYVRSSALPNVPPERRYYVLGDRSPESIRTATPTPTRTATESPLRSTETTTQATRTIPASNVQRKNADGASRSGSPLDLGLTGGDLRVVGLAGGLSSVLVAKYIQSRQ